MIHHHQSSPAVQLCGFVVGNATAAFGLPSQETVGLIFGALGGIGSFLIGLSAIINVFRKRDTA